MNIKKQGFFNFSLRKAKIFYFLFFLFLITITLLSSCSNNINSTYKEFREKQEIAKTMCDNRNGEVIHFGIIVNPINLKQNFESVCFKADENRFYYEIVN